LENLTTEILNNSPQINTEFPATFINNLIQEKAIQLAEIEEKSIQARDMFGGITQKTTAVKQNPQTLKTENSTSKILQTQFTKDGFQPTPKATILKNIETEISNITTDTDNKLPPILFNDIKQIGAIYIAECEKIVIQTKNVNVIDPYRIKQQTKKLGLRQGLFSRTGVTVQFKGTVGFKINEEIIISDSEHDYNPTETIILDSHGIAMVWCLATEKGDWTIPAETVTIIKTRLPKDIKLSCINFNEGVPSRGEETIEELQERVFLAYNTPFAGSENCLRGLLGAIGIKQRLIFVQQSPFKIVVGGLFDDYQVALAIYNSGAFFPSLTLHESRGQDKTEIIISGANKYSINFVKASEFLLSFDIILNISNKSKGIETIKKNVANFIFNYINNLKINDALNLCYIEMSIFSIMTSIILSDYCGKSHIIFYSLDSNNERLEPLKFNGNIYQLDNESYPTIEMNQIKVTTVYYD
jgi:hypothetical protein